MKDKKKTEEKDYYFNKEGLLVLTESFLRKRGVCCHNSCKHCPYKDCFCHEVKKSPPEADHPLDEK